MMLIVSTLVVALVGSTVQAHNLDDSSYSFDAYVEEYGKVYESKEEFGHRQAIFEQNLETILSHNQQATKSYYVMGVNPFTDQLDDELPLGYDKSFHSAWRGSSKSSLASERKLEAEKTSVRNIVPFR
jgi:hypothetical protein